MPSTFSNPVRGPVAEKNSKRNHRNAFEYALFSLFNCGFNKTMLYTNLRHDQFNEKRTSRMILVNKHFQTRAPKMISVPGPMVPKATTADSEGKYFYKMGGSL